MLYMVQTLSFPLALLAMLFSALPGQAKKKREHLHRYFLSEYKPQHSPRVYWDYVPHRSKKKADHEEESARRTAASEAVEEPVEEIPINELVVRIYNDHKFLCSGTLLTDTVVITAYTCFLTAQPGYLTVKTYIGDTYGALIQNTTQTYAPGGDTSLLTTLVLKQPIEKFKGKVTLCKSILKKGDRVTMPKWEDSHTRISSMDVAVIDREECKQMTNDPEGKLVSESTTCVKNKRLSKSCLNTFGEPLIHDNQICGINIMGHNCPQKFGADVFLSLYDAETYIDEKVEMVKKSGIDKILA